jgi:hypothetical protein
MKKHQKTKQCSKKSVVNNPSDLTMQLKRMKEQLDELEKRLVLQHPLTEPDVLVAVVKLPKDDENDEHYESDGYSDSGDEDDDDDKMVCLVYDNNQLSIHKEIDVIVNNDCIQL